MGCGCGSLEGAYRGQSSVAAVVPDGRQSPMVTAVAAAHPGPDSLGKALLGASEAEPGAEGETFVSVSVHYMSGSTAWGPSLVSSLQSVEALQQQVAEALQTPLSPGQTLRLAYAGTMLELSQALKSAGLEDGVELTLILVSLQNEYAAIFAQLCDQAKRSSHSVENPKRLFRRSFLEELRGTSEMEFMHVWNDSSSTEAEAAKDIAEISRACGCVLPETIACWLELLLLSGRLIMDTRGGPRVTLQSQDFRRSSQRVLQQPGLLYLIAPDPSKDSFVYYMVDLHGKLGYGEGAVWYACVLPEENGCGFCPSLQAWLHRFALQSVDAPIAVAEDMTSFFDAWAKTDKGPPREAMKLDY